MQLRAIIGVAPRRMRISGDSPRRKAVRPGWDLFVLTRNVYLNNAPTVVFNILFFFHYREYKTSHAKVFRYCIEAKILVNCMLAASEPVYCYHNQSLTISIRYSLFISLTCAKMYLFGQIKTNVKSIYFHDIFTIIN